MNEAINQLLINFRALPPGRQVMLALATLGSLAFFLWLSSGLAATEYRALYRGVDSEEAAAITDALREERIDYRLDEGGTSIMVPAAMLHEARIRIAGRDVTDLPPARRPVTTVFQEHNLFAHLDVAANVGLGIHPGLKLTADDKSHVGAALREVSLVLAHFASEVPRLDEGEGTTP